MRIGGACCLFGDVASAACARGGALRRPRACRCFLSLLVACFSSREATTLRSKGQTETRGQ